MREISTAADPGAIQIYLLGVVDYDTVLRLQRRLVYEVSGDGARGALILCEHFPVITVGREGSRGHIHFDPRELSWRGWPIRWVNRAGGCVLHLPGQLAAYPILPLDRFGLDVPAYLEKLQRVVMEVAADFMLHPQTRPGRAGVWIGNRLLAHVGIAVRNWVSYFGAALNVSVDLDLFRRVDVDGHPQPMTSLERERRLAVNPAMVRQRFLEHWLEQFGVTQTTLFDYHPLLPGKPLRDALVAPALGS